MAPAGGAAFDRGRARRALRRIAGVPGRGRIRSRTRCPAPARGGTFARDPREGSTWNRWVKSFLWSIRRVESARPPPPSTSARPSPPRSARSSSSTSTRRRTRPPGWVSPRTTTARSTACSSTARHSRDIIRETELPTLHLAPSSVDLVSAEIELSDEDDRATRLRTALALVRDRYDYILIDSPPSLGLLTVNGLAAADTVLVPLQCEYFALEGVSQLMRTLDQVREGLNPALEIEGIALTMYDDRINLSRQVAARDPRVLRREGLSDGRPSERPPRRGAVLRKADHSLRHPLAGK